MKLYKKFEEIRAMVVANKPCHYCQVPYVESDITYLGDNGEMLFIHLHCHNCKSCAFLAWNAKTDAVHAAGVPHPTGYDDDDEEEEEEPVMAGPGPDWRGFHSRLLPSRPPTVKPITRDNVLDMHQYLNRPDANLIFNYDETD